MKRMESELQRYQALKEAEPPSSSTRSFVDLNISLAHNQIVSLFGARSHSSKLTGVQDNSPVESFVTSEASEHRLSDNFLVIGEPNIPNIPVMSCSVRLTQDERIMVTDVCRADHTFCDSSDVLPQDPSTSTRSSLDSGAPRERRASLDLEHRLIRQR
jgi:hypothetical protein